MKELKRIFVVGHPAAGKALFSKHLAERLGYKFIDADMGLEHKIGLTINEILGQAGLKPYEHTQEIIFDSAVLAYLQQNEFTLVKPVGLTESELVYFKYNTDIPVRISEQQAISLKHLSKGKTAKEIAREMNISYRTVEVYIAQLKEKLECDSSKELISIYLSKH